MGIDRHEWEHRNYKSGRTAAAPALLADDDIGQLPVDASLGDASLQPETSKAETSKAKAKAASKDNSKDAPETSSGPKASSGPKVPSKTSAKTTSGGKRPARAR